MRIGHALLTCDEDTDHALGGVMTVFSDVKPYLLPQNRVFSVDALKKIQEFSRVNN